MKPFRIALWALVGLALIGFGLLLVRGPASAPASGDSTEVTIGGPFTLVGTDGRPFSSAQLSGKPFAIFFGFTHCPDVCPTTLARLSKLRTQLNQGAEPFRIVFVTVDPERDTPAEMASYASLFPTPVVALTGSPAQIEQVKKQFKVFSQKVPDGSGGYSVDHTATILLFDRNGKFTSTIAPEEGDAVAIDKLKRITAGLS